MAIHARLAFSLCSMCSFAAVRASDSERTTSPDAVARLLRPQASETRAALTLDGVWRVKADPADAGRMERWWENELDGLVLDAPVPATLNEVLAADPTANWTDVRTRGSRTQIPLVL